MSAGATDPRMSATMLKYQISLIFLAVLLAGIACSTKVKNLDTPEGTMAEAERLFDDEFFDEARTQFYRIKTEFPSSPYQAQADLRVADSYFKEESFSVAATSYEEFVKTYPGNDKLPYALYRMGLSFANQMPSNVQRDSRATRRAADTFTRLLVDYPNCEYVDEAQKQVDRAQSELAEKIYEIGRFYEKKEDFLAAAKRYGEVADVYSDQKIAEESFARQIKMLRSGGQGEQADELSKIFQTRYPSSEFRTMIRP